MEEKADLAQIGHKIGNKHEGVRKEILGIHMIVAVCMRILILLPVITNCQACINEPDTHFAVLHKPWMAGFDVQSSVAMRVASTFVSALVEGSPAQSAIALMPS